MLDCLRAARYAIPNAGRIAEFLEGCMGADGGFRGRGRHSDLYFTVFGVEALAALGGDVRFDRVEAYLRGFGGGKGLDFVHLACLARCWADMPGGPPDQSLAGEILARIEAHRSDDGGYHSAHGRAHGSAYACFLALGAYQDMGADLPRPGGLITCLAGLRTADGAYANEQEIPAGATPATAAAAVVLRQLGEPVAPSVGEWLCGRFGDEGGFRAAPAAPVADLLSTATALHALATLGADLDDLRGPCLDFVLGLQAGDGSFRAHVLDETGDCEYTFYAMLAMGRLCR